MKSTQLKKSRRWNSMMLNLKIQGSKGPFTPPSYSHIYKLKVVKEKKIFEKKGIKFELNAKLNETRLDVKKDFEFTNLKCF